MTRAVRSASFFLAAFLSASAVFAASADEIFIAVGPGAVSEGKAESLEALERRLERSLQKSVEIFEAPDEAALLDVLRSGSVHAAILDAGTALTAVKKAGARVELAEVREIEAGGETRESTLDDTFWVVHAQSPVGKLEDLKGKTVSFPGESSADGYVVPVAGLAKAGLVPRAEGAAPDLAAFFKSIVFKKSWRESVDELKFFRVDATVISRGVPASLYKEVADHTRVVGSSGPVPTAAVVFAGGFSDPIRSELKKAFSEAKEGDVLGHVREALLARFIRFEPADDAHLEPLVSAAEAAGATLVEEVPSAPAPPAKTEAAGSETAPAPL